MNVRDGRNDFPGRRSREQGSDACDDSTNYRKLSRKIASNRNKNHARQKQKRHTDKVEITKKVIKAGVCMVDIRLGTPESGAP